MIDVYIILETRLCQMVITKNLYKEFLDIVSSIDSGSGEEGEKAVFEVGEGEIR